MSYTPPTVNYSDTLTGTYTSLTGVQSVSVNRGRQRFQDNFPPTSCVIELIPANSYTVPLAVGQYIDVRDTNSASSPCYFQGRITDVSRKFSMPFNSSTGSAPSDRITINATGASGVVAQTSVTDYDTQFANTDFAIGEATFVNANVVQSGSFIVQTRSSVFLFTGSVWDLINGYLRTSTNFIDDLDTIRANRLPTVEFFVFTFSPGVSNLAFNFSDSGTVGAFKFDNLEFVSSVQNTFTKVEVVAQNVGTATETSGNPPFNTLVYNTFSETLNDAQKLAQLILSRQDSLDITPFLISTNTLIAPTCTTLGLLRNTDILTAPPENRGMNLGSAVTVEFRGTTVEAQIQGINTTFYPDQARVQLYLSPALGAQFVLDNTTFGVLDQNKLGL